MTIETTKTTAPKSFVAEVIADTSGKWVGNGLRFATKEEGENYANDLMGRWTAVREARVVPSQDPVNYRWANGKAEPIKELPASAL